MAATAVWRDEMQGVARSQGSFSLTSGTTRQFASQAPSRRACFARYQRGGCGQIGCSLASTAWRQSPSYDLRRTRRDLPDLTRNAVHGGINQRFLKYSHEVAATYSNLDGGSSVGFILKSSRKKEDAKIVHQSSPTPKGGRYRVAYANAIGNTAVSILAHPEGRALPSLIKKGASTAPFQSSPAPKGGRYKSFCAD